MLLAGASRVVITPPLETPIGGFGEWNRRHFTGLTADIYVRALVLERERGAAFAVASVEATETSEPVVNWIRREVERRAEIPAAHVVVAMTHNHSGPQLMRMAEPYVQVAARKIADAVVLARGRLRPARLGWAERDIAGPATNRRILLRNGRVWPRFFMGQEIPTRENAADAFSPLNYAPNLDYRWAPAAEEIVGPGPVNPRLSVMKVVDAGTGAALAVLAHYGCHASVALESRNIHGDFPGFACERAEEVTGATCLFLAGPSANINCNAFLRERSDAEARRVGLEFAGQVIEAQQQALPEMEDGEIAVQCIRLSLPLRDEMRPGGATLGGAADDREKIRKEAEFLEKLADEGVIPPVLRQGALEIEMTAARVDSCVLVSFPGEMFVETGFRLCGASHWPHTWIVTHTNGWAGYVPEKAAFGQGGYEDTPSYCSFVGPESEELILRAWKRLLAEN